MKKDMEQIRATVKKMQRTVWPILCDIEDFCEERGITCYLSGGTLLGAVRHQGFIPWDDDADLMMPRKDYDRFFAEYPASRAGRYGVGELSMDRDWYWQYGRVWDLHSRLTVDNLEDRVTGMYVDVFPIDGLPENPLKRKFYYARIVLLRGLGFAAVRRSFLEGEKGRLGKKILRALVRPFGIRFFSERMVHHARKYPFETSKYVGASLAAHYGERETLPRAAMEGKVLLPFEGRMFPAPSGYREYLTHLYGNYMEIPPDAEERGCFHLCHWQVEFDVPLAGENPEN